jgi:hypothetical protein
MVWKCLLIPLQNNKNTTVKQLLIQLLIEGIAVKPSDFGIYEIIDHGEMNNQRTNK